MITHPPGLLSTIRELCDRYEVLLICDEVATGFGRTGRLMACEHESVTPDILCLGKGLTGGYLPMAATIARSHVYEAFLAPATQLHQFFHGHTFAGNPLAAAAAIASIELFQQQDLVAKVNEKSTRLRRALEPLVDHPHVGDIRGRGLMVGIELVASRDTRTSFNPAEQIGPKVCRRALDRGVWIRPLSDVIILMPPLVAGDDELDLLADVVVDSIQTELAASQDNVLASG
jgi:adenosylmethionine-8-amino-7-oxononanoate aminotransferase